MARTENRLTVLGSKRNVQSFRNGGWERPLRAQYCELIENSPKKFSCQFVTESPPLESLRKLSGRWAGLIFLLDYETEARRTKGLAKARAGLLEHHQIRY